ncbi:MAG: hypothetical protein AB7P23_08325, partial [Amphiplicatus sp.]
ASAATGRYYAEDAAALSNLGDYLYRSEGPFRSSDDAPFVKVAYEDGGEETLALGDIRDFLLSGEVAWSKEGQASCAAN